MASAIFHNSNVTVMKLKKLNLAATGGKCSQLKITFCCSFKYSCTTSKVTIHLKEALE